MGIVTGAQFARPSGEELLTQILLGGPILPVPGGSDRASAKKKDSMSYSEI